MEKIDRSNDTLVFKNTETIRNVNSDISDLLFGV